MLVTDVRDEMCWKLSDLFPKNFEKKFFGILLGNEIIRANHEMRF